MKVRYTGPLGDGIKVVHPDPASPDANTVTVCPPGEVVDLPDGPAAELVHAGVLDPVDPPRKRKTAMTAAEEGD